MFPLALREGSLEVLKDLLTRNLRQNLNIVVQIATKYSDPLGPENLMKVWACVGDCVCVRR